MHNDLVYCLVRIRNMEAYIRSAVTYLTDAANDFNEKTNNNPNLHSTIACGPVCDNWPYSAVLCFGHC